jgi:hypothetical protein
VSSIIIFDDETYETAMSELSDESYSGEERLIKLEAELENTKKRIPINDEKIESTKYTVSDDFDNSQQQSKQNQKGQFLDFANQQINDYSADLAQQLEKVKKENDEDMVSMTQLYSVTSYLLKIL